MKRYDDPLWWLTTVLNDVGFVELERGMETDDFFIEMTYSGNYDERTVMDVLDMLVPYTQEGCISYIGEDNTYWRHQFVDGVWVKLRGQICYETPEQCRCQTFPQTHANLERLISESGVMRSMITGLMRRKLVCCWKRMIKWILTAYCWL